MQRQVDILLTAIAPAIWGSTYLVTTELLPDNYPITVAMLRALPAGLLLLLVVRQLPQGAWWGKVFILGAANFSIFWWLLFISAYRLPGGVAATVGAIGPLVVVGLSRIFLGAPIRFLAVVGAIGGVAGVALLVLTPHAKLDHIGVLAGIAGAVSMAFGTVLSRRWQPPVSPLTFTAWQLTAGGVLLLPFALLAEPPLPHLSASNIAGFLYLGLISAAATYILWFRGLARLEPTIVAPLAFFSPLTATVLGWSVLGQQLSWLQLAGMAAVIASVWVSHHAQTDK